MVEFAVALGSKLGVINKHSFNNFRLRVGEGPPLLGQRRGYLLSPLPAVH
jgi:adenylate cyclase 4